jgi:hypothetical protein
VPKLCKIDTEMQRWCALLEEEVATWPQVRTKSMFGMMSLYRGKNIFAAVPRTRAMGTARSVLIKLPGMKEKSLKRASGPGAGWITFEINSERDITEGLRWLEQAYEKAGHR